MACTRPDPAPTDLDGLAHFFFDRYRTEDGVPIADGVLNAEAWFNDNAVDGILEGTVTDLTPEQVELVGMPSGLSMDNLVGVFLFWQLSCTVSEIERIYLDPNQADLFPGRYVAYGRTYHDGLDCYVDGGCDDANWTIHIEDSLLGKPLVYDLESGTSRIDFLATDQTHVIGMMSRTWMPEEAVIGSGDGSAFFDQSYQIELFYPHGGGTIHLYALWNSAGLQGIDPGSAIWPNSYLDGIRDWDTRLIEICDQGLVP